VSQLHESDGDRSRSPGPEGSGDTPPDSGRRDRRPVIGVLGVLAIVYGIFFLLTAWVGHFALSGFWPGRVRLGIATCIGVVSIAWGWSRARSHLPREPTRMPMTFGQAVLIVGSLILATAFMVIFFSW
jgi:hypothetical protein